MTPRSHDLPRRLFFVAALVLVLAATLFPVVSPASPSACTPFDLTCGHTRAVDMILNVALFLPLGAALQLRWRRAWASVATGLVLSGVIEVLQATVIPGRDPSLRDLIANSVGAAAGAGLALIAPTLARPSAAAAAALTGALAVVFSAVLLLAAPLLEVSLHRGLWWGQHQATLEGFDVFPGRLLAATLSSRPLPSGPLPREVSRRVVLSGSIALGGRIASGRAVTERLAPIVSVFEGSQRKMAILGQIGAAAAFTPRLKAEDWGFRPVVARFPEIDLATGPATLDLEGSYRDGIIVLRVAAAGAADSVEYRHPLGPADWWRLVAPWGVALSAGAAEWVTAGGLLLWFAALGWYAGRWGRRPWAVAAAVALVAAPAMLALVPTPLGYPVAAPSSWLAVLAGVGLGWSGAARRRPFASEAGSRGGGRPGLRRGSRPQDRAA